MFGVALRLLATGEAGRRVGDHVKNLMTRYIFLSVAGFVFLVATAFAILAGFWALDSWMQNPIWAALIMMGICILAGCLIALTAYGITRKRPKSVSAAMRDPLQAVQSNIPSVEDVGRGIESAVRRYGPVRVTAAAVAGGLVAGLLAKRFGQPRVVYEEAPPPRRNGRRYSNGRHYA
jgi:Putative Actinobacterial Holin-X, holin superfamily III